MVQKQKPLDRDDAEDIAIAALTFLASNGERLGRFLATTGVGPEALKASARNPQTLASVLDFLLQDESLLLMFTTESHLAPDVIVPAHTILADAHP